LVLSFLAQPALLARFNVLPTAGFDCSASINRSKPHTLTKIKDLTLSPNDQTKTCFSLSLSLSIFSSLSACISMCFCRPFPVEMTGLWRAAAFCMLGLAQCTKQLHPTCQGPSGWLAFFLKRSDRLAGWFVLLCNRHVLIFFQIC